jgi:hypothetical protein
MNRFELQWLPRQPGLSIHVMLLDRARPAPYVVTAGHGADRLQALGNLCSALIEQGAIAEAIDFVATEYERRSRDAPPTSSG